ncbi:hypothetical protein [Anabaena sphaerica]|nr:hypothetical protein [Anabaena sphaerica]
MQLAVELFHEEGFDEKQGIQQPVIKQLTVITCKTCHCLLI